MPSVDTQIMEMLEKCGCLVHFRHFVGWTKERLMKLSLRELKKLLPNDPDAQTDASKILVQIIKDHLVDAHKSNVGNLNQRKEDEGLRKRDHHYRRSDRRYSPKPSDDLSWICTRWRCGYYNYYTRMECNKCGGPRHHRYVANSSGRDDRRRREDRRRRLV